MSSCIAAQSCDDSGDARADCFHRFLDFAFDVDLFLDTDQNRRQRAPFLDAGSFLPHHLNRIRRFAPDLPRDEQRQSDHDDRNNRAAEQSPGIAAFLFICDRAVQGIQGIRDNRERERPRERGEKRLRQEITKIKREHGLWGESPL
jgi:hypothetical protein